jgi:sigma-E factor negative regulatory protein RseB
MRQRASTITLIWGCLLPAVVLANPAASPAMSSPRAEAGASEPADARAWLDRIHAAARQRNYQGTMVFTAGGVLSSTRVAHFCIGDQCYERIEALDGRQQRVYRHNDVVQTIWPQSRLALVETRSVSTQLRSLTLSAEPRALEQYELRPEGRERVAGREAWVFLLKPRDDLRYAQRLWADQASGLMLRADVISPVRVVLESAAFSEVEIGIRPLPDSVLQPMKKLAGYRVLRPQQVPTQLASEGWTMVREVPGFLLKGCLKRPLEAPPSDDEPAASASPESGAAARAAAPAPAQQVLQAVFSDGLTHVSLFIEPYEPQRHKALLQAQIGATSTLMHRRGDYWITAMGEVPAATLKLFTDALERRR